MKDIIMQEDQSPEILLSVGEFSGTNAVRNEALSWNELKTTLKNFQPIAVMYLNAITKESKIKATPENKGFLNHEQTIEQAIITAKKKLHYFVGGQFEPNIRNNDNLINRSLVVLDIDKYAENIDALEAKFDKELSDFDYIAYSTISHSPEKPSVRVVLRCNGTVPKEHYKEAVTNFVNTLGFKDSIDIKATTTLSQAMYLPAELEITQQSDDKPIYKYIPWLKENVSDLGGFDYKKYQNQTTQILTNANYNTDSSNVVSIDKRRFPKGKVTKILDGYPAELLGYHDWLAVGMALHHYYSGEEQGLTLWQAWSELDTREGQYDAEEIIKKYASFKLDAQNIITIATISKRASKSQVKAVDGVILDKVIGGHKFNLTKDTLYVMIEKVDEFGNAIETAVRVSDYIELQGQGVNSNGQCCFVMSILDRDKQYKEIFVPLVARTECLKQSLLDSGLVFNPTHFIVLVNYILANRTDNKLNVEYRLGWNDDHTCYSLMTKKDGLKHYYRNDKDEQVKSVVEFKLKDSDLLYQKGSLEDWQDNIAKYADKNSNLAFVIYASFAPIFLTPLNRDGVVLHLFGKSSIGKTIALSTAASVWGYHGKGYIQWHGTTNSMENLGLQKNDGLLCMDELTALQGRHTVATVPYLLINGQSKNRADSKGEGFGNRTKKTWKTLVLSTGETTFDAKMKSVDEEIKGGQTVRFIDIPALASEELGVFEHLYNFQTPKDLALHIHDACNKYKGTAITEFLEYCFTKSNFDELTEKVTLAKKMWLNKYVPEGATSQVERVADIFATIAAIGELAIASGVLPEKYGFIKGKAFTDTDLIFNRWLGQLEDYTISAETRILKDRVRSFWYKHHANDFYKHKKHSDDDGNNGVVQQRCVGIYGRASEGSGSHYSTQELEEYFVFKQSFEEEVLQGLDFKDMINIMRKQGYIHKTKNNRSLHSKYYSKIDKNINCYKLNLKALGISTDE